MKLRPVFKCHGGKYYLADWVLRYFPLHNRYVEPFVGGGSVFLNKAPCDVEVINDLDATAMCIYDTLQTRGEEFIEKLKTLEYRENVFLDYVYTSPTTIFDIAIKSYVLRRMSRGGLQTSFAWSDRQRGGKPGDVNAWETAIAELPKIVSRLQHVTIRNKRAVEVLEEFNDVNTLVYCDPPYVHSTRVSKNAYQYEMNEADHVELSYALRKFKGKVLLSGYPSELYRELYGDWNFRTKEIINHSSQQEEKEYKIEALWSNFV